MLPFYAMKIRGWGGEHIMARRGALYVKFQWSSSKNMLKLVIKSSIKKCSKFVSMASRTVADSYFNVIAFPTAFITKGYTIFVERGVFSRKMTVLYLNDSYKTRSHTCT